jgi:hypothetical protein
VHILSTTSCRARSRGSSVGIATSYGLGGREFGDQVPVGVKNFLFSTSSRPALGPTQLPIQCVPGALSQGSSEYLVRRSYYVNSAFENLS